jgi:ribulose 1,5-bisphosphate synthetase/thiazole synthase
MPGSNETEISKAIISTYHDKLLSRIVNDVLIVEASHGLR